jgi:hypothetical protein
MLRRAQEDLLYVFKAARRRAARAANSAPTLHSRCRSPLRAGRQPVGQARIMRNPSGRWDVRRSPRDGARSGVDGCARRVGASGSGMAPNQVRLVGGWGGSLSIPPAVIPGQAEQSRRPTGGTTANGTARKEDSRLWTKSRLDAGIAAYLF